MMRKVILLVLLMAAGAYYWKDRQQISEAKINGFLRVQTAALQKMDAEALCEQLSPTFRGNVVQVVGGQVHPQTTNREENCDAMRQFFDRKMELDRSLPAGSEYGIDYTLDVDRITISGDKKEALVELRTRLNLANLVVFDAATTDTLRMDKGKVMLEASQGRVVVSGRAAGTLQR